VPLLEEQISMTDIFVHSSPAAPEAQPVLDGLLAESVARYGSGRPGGPRAEIDRYPPKAFAPPFGDFLLLVRDGETIAGGGFMSHDDETAEFKRIWTRPDLRRQGLARRVVTALEDRAAELGYTRAYLTTGYLQKEAVSLYVRLNFRPLFDLDADPKLFRSLPFEKHIGAKAGQPGTSIPRKPAASFEAATQDVAAIKAAQEKKILERLFQHLVPAE
jgi:GNAT superfamily N-acetyltransferase